jgi:hypothetical protein
VRCPDALAVEHKVAAGIPLTKAERLLLAPAALETTEPAPATAEEAYRRLAEAIRAIEKCHLPDAVVASWGQGGREALVDEAFRAYAYEDPDSAYDENPFPKAFSEVLKSPARRYRWRGASADREIVLQLEHVTIFHEGGGLEIQRIDPAVRTCLADRDAPLVVEILDDAEYFRRLSEREDLVLFRRPGRGGHGVWSPTSTVDERGSRSSR